MLALGDFAVVTFVIFMNLFNLDLFSNQHSRVWLLLGRGVGECLSGGVVDARVWQAGVVSGFIESLCAEGG
jgi:hypothetical protein